MAKCYDYDVACANCKRPQTLTIPKGVEIKSYIMILRKPKSIQQPGDVERICAVCGCDVVERWGKGVFNGRYPQTTDASVRG